MKAQGLEKLISGTDSVDQNILTEKLLFSLDLHIEFTQYMEALRGAHLSGGLFSDYLNGIEKYTEKQTLNDQKSAVITTIEAMGNSIELQDWAFKLLIDPKYDPPVPKTASDLVLVELHLHCIVRALSLTVKVKGCKDVDLSILQSLD